MLEKARRPVVGGDEDVGKRVWVRQQHVESWPQALDEVCLQKEGFCLGSRDDELHRRRLAHHSPNTIGMTTSLRVIADALFEAAGLADIKNVAGFIDHA